MIARAWAIVPRRPQRMGSLEDGEVQQRVGAAQGGFGLSGYRGAGEDEAEIARSLGQRDDRVALGDGDGDVLDAGDGARGLEPADLFEDAAARDRDHHDARCGTLALERGDGPAQRVAQDDLLERHAGAEAQRARAQPPDGARGPLDEPRARLINTQLRVNGP